MGSKAKRNGIVNNEGFKSRVNRYLHSGDTKHVMAGMAIITLIFGVPWFLMNRGSSEQTSDTFEYVVPNEILFTFQTGSKMLEAWSSRSKSLNVSEKGLKCYSMLEELQFAEIPQSMKCQAGLFHLLLLGTKHSSHQDYMEKADKARHDRLSSGSAAP